MSEIGDIASILMLNGGGSLPRKGDNPVLEALIDGALKKSQEPGFFSREAGQKRRAWLDETVNYFTPPELRGPLGLINEANPVTSMERASTASQTMLAPETSGWGRVAAGGDMLSNMAGVVAPAMVAGKAGLPAVNAIEEGLLGWAPGMPAAAGNFVADEFGGLRLYHGSPHDFDKFSMDKIGTGEGAQAYGHGLYFAEAEDTAKAYRDQLQFPRIDGASTPVEKVADDLNYHRGNVEGVKKIYEGMLANGDEAAKKMAQEKLAALPEAVDRFKGRMYEVDVNANPEDFVDIEMPLKDQPALEPALRKYWGRHYDSYMSDPYTNDGDFFRQLAQDPVNKNLYLKEMREAGIPGLKYKDAGSRGADGDGSRNYVVFDENLISIVKKYGIAGAATMLGVTQADVAQAMEGQQ